MLPGTAVEAVEFDSDKANYAFSVAMRLKETTGEVLDYRIMPSRLNPCVTSSVYLLSY